jgi:hypothetical protein
MARVEASGSPSLTSAAAFHTQLRSLPTFGDSFMSGTTTTVSLVYKKSEKRGERKHTVVVGAHLESLISAHNQASLLVLLVLQQADVASTTLLPLARLAVKLEQLSTHLKHLLFQLLVGLGLDLLGEVDDGLEFDFRRLGCFFL